MSFIMDNAQTIENQVLECLNSGKTPGDLLVMTVSLLGEAVDKLLLQVFRKDDYAVKYVVEPLLHRHGPLGELPVRLKLLYGLGVMSRADYEDCELLLALCDELSRSEKRWCFTDDSIRAALEALHCAGTVPVLPQCSIQSDARLAAMQQQRYQQMIRSSIVLALTELISRISTHRPFAS